MNKCLCGLCVEGSSNTTNLTEPIEACRTYAKGRTARSQKIQKHPEQNYTTQFPLYSFPHPITFFPGPAVAVAARFLWVGLSCQSIRHHHFICYVVALLPPNFSPAGAIHQHSSPSPSPSPEAPHYPDLRPPAIVAFEVQWLTKRNVSNFIWIGLKVITELQRPSSVALTCNVMCRKSWFI